MIENNSPNNYMSYTKKYICLMKHFETKLLFYKQFLENGNIVLNKVYANRNILFFINHFFIYLLSIYII